jgi:dTDP-3-amino-2,3,6-trideoxy-4-keto-D-glucose/dTDP-3-amino-3,4,6-trideoxy-alpha-D-glucose/dTDP-2,6-dideoxy-D-kanosamine transaminase
MKISPIIRWEFNFKNTMNENPQWKVRYIYLDKQFAHPEEYFEKAKEIVMRGDFTLGKALQDFEADFSRKFGVMHAIGVGNGTDALYLSLKALGIGAGDEVITAPNSFIATAGAIALTDARPTFVDVRDDYLIDPDLIERAITPKTKAIMPVQLTGSVADMKPILEIAKKHNLFVVEDAAQAASARYDNQYVGSFGTAAGFSFHPLKILNLWGDGGMITTNDDALAHKLRLMRNHGLKNRNEAVFFAHNSRLDTFHAAIASVMFKQLDKATEVRTAHAKLYDSLLNELEPMVHVPRRNLNKAVTSPIYTTYIVQARNRERLIEFLKTKGVEALIHYPIPIHLQEAAEYLGYKKGDFPVCERQAEEILTLPIHQFLAEEDIRYVCDSIREFYQSSGQVA